MKRSVLIFFAAVSMLFTGCTDNSYRGLLDVEDSGHQAVPLPIWIQIGEPVGPLQEPLKSMSKGTGSITGAESFVDRPIYIYAFNQEMSTSLSTVWEEDLTRCLIDASIDTPGAKGGRKAYYDKEKQLVRWDRGGDLYWPLGEEMGNRYDFFAYYIDDMVLEEDAIHRSDDAVIIDIEIDGMQDVMSSKASPTDDKLASVFPEPEDGKGSKEELEEIYKERHLYKTYYCYGYQAALKTLYPEFIFKHHLVKLDFCVKPGLTPGYLNRMKIDGIRVTSRYKAAFTVADKSDPTNVGLVFDDKEEKQMEVREADGSPLKTDETYEFWTRGSTQTKLEPIMIGSSLLVAPDADYDIEVTLTERRYEDGEEKWAREGYVHATTVKIPSARFEAGSEYLITFGVAGTMDISISAEIADWENGGGHIYDKEERPGE